METNDVSYRRESYGRGRERIAALVLLAALALLAVLALVVPQGTEQPTGTEYLIAANAAHERTPVGGLIDIEDAWAIEDERSEAEAPLVRSMFNGESALGYDAGSETFFCTLGVEDGQDWPALALSVQDAPGVSVVWIDDYAYDFCDEAIAEGYRYELLAYTDTEYAYFGVVFTGLPIVSWHTYDADTPIRREYVQGYASVSSAQHDAINSAAQIHVRGGGAPKPVDKPSYRLEFHEQSRKGRDKTREVSVLGMEPDSDWLLISNASDKTVISNHLCWKLWSMWTEGEAVPGRLGSQIVELFIDDEYMGMYNLLQCVREERELEHIGGNLSTDCVYRVLRRWGDDFSTVTRPVLNYSETISSYVEVRYVPKGLQEERVQAICDPYELLMRQGESALSDEEFAGLVQSVADQHQLLSYYLFFQVCQLPEDNVYNNRFIWMLREDDGYRMMITPWDMDAGLGKKTEENKPEYIFFGLPMEERMLTLNVGNCREELWAIWNEKKNTLLTEEALYTWIRGEEAYINASGAYLRESEHWYGAAEPLDLAALYENELEFINTIEMYLKELWPLTAQSGA